MSFPVWSLVVGGVLILMALAGSVLSRLPVSAAMIYMSVGYALAAAGLLPLDPVADAPLLERLTEVAVLVSLFTAGLKLRASPADRRWRVPVRLATVSMALTVGLIAAAGVLLFGLPLGAAVLLGGVLAPTDPVLAADVQVSEPGDRDRVRFSLTAEAGLNDGTALPFVLLGLGLLGLHDLGAGGWRWWAVDVLWMAAGGLGIGFALGTAVGKVVTHLRARHRQAVGLDNFLALGLVAVAYALATLAGAGGFLAVFAAGLGLRGVERRRSGEHMPHTGGDDAAVHPDTAHAYMPEAVLGFNEQLEKVFEVAAVLVLGGLLAAVPFSWAAVGLAAVVFVAARPAAVWAGLVGTRTGAEAVRGWLIGWFGVRGVGTLYYLLYAANHGLPPALARHLSGLVLWTVALSVVAHGVSVTPLMGWYTGWRGRRGSSG